MTMRRKPTVKFPMKVEFSTFCQVICQLFLLFSTIWVLDVKENRLLVANESKCRHAARAHAPRGYQISITGSLHKEAREDPSSGSLILISGFLPARFYPIRYEVPHPPFVSHAIIFAFFMQRKEFQYSVRKRKRKTCSSWCERAKVEQ